MEHEQKTGDRDTPQDTGELRSYISVFLLDPRFLEGRVYVPRAR